MRGGELLYSTHLNYHRNFWLKVQVTISLVSISMGSFFSDDFSTFFPRGRNTQISHTFRYLSFYFGRHLAQFVAKFKRIKSRGEMFKTETNIRISRRNVIQFSLTGTKVAFIAKFKIRKIMRFVEKLQSKWKQLQQKPGQVVQLLGYGNFKSSFQRMTVDAFSPCKKKHQNKHVVTDFQHTRNQITKKPFGSIRCSPFSQSIFGRKISTDLYLSYPNHLCSEQARKGE